MMMTMSNACDQDSFCDALVYCRGTKRDKSKRIAEKAKKKETRTREKVTRKERCEKKMKSRRRLERERERERRSEESFPQHKFYYENSLIRKTQPTTHAYWYILFTKL